jgi:hypothetical protein
MKINTLNATLTIITNANMNKICCNKFEPSDIMTNKFNHLIKILMKIIRRERTS